MKKMDTLDRIETNPKILLGKPVIKGTRIPVYLILELLGAGYTPEKVVESYPSLALEDVNAAVLYAAQVMKSEENVFLKAGNE